MMLDYRVLTFLTLYDEMNYRRTAEKLNMTQPGVTQHIHYLEHYYGVKLFSYDGRTLSRTQKPSSSSGILTASEQRRWIFGENSFPPTLFT